VSAIKEDERKTKGYQRELFNLRGMSNLLSLNQTWN